MIENNKTSRDSNELLTSNKEDFDVNILYKFFIRNKNFIAKVSLIFLIFGCH